jgi:hypothetical protein
VTVQLLDQSERDLLRSDRASQIIRTMRMPTSSNPTPKMIQPSGVVGSQPASAWHVESAITANTSDPRVWSVSQQRASVCGVAHRSAQTRGRRGVPARQLVPGRPPNLSVALRDRPPSRFLSNGRTFWGGGF